MSTLTGKDLNLVKPALTDDHKVTIGTDLPANFQKIDDEFSAHLADGATNDNLPHGATSAATVNKIIARDANGRAKVSSPTGEVSGEIVNISEYFASDYPGDTPAISNVLEIQAVYLLSTHSIISPNDSTAGLYLVYRKGDECTVTSIVADTTITVTIDASQRIVLTKVVSAAGLLGTLIKINA